MTVDYALKTALTRLAYSMHWAGDLPETDVALGPKTALTVVIVVAVVFFP